MALFNVRLSDDLAGRFDVWAAGRGGRSAALRQLISGACAREAGGAVARRDSAPRPVKLTVRLSAADGAGLEAVAAEMSMSPSAWVAALVVRRLAGRPRFARSDQTPLLGVLGEVHRIGVNVNQMARALNTAVLEGRVVELQLQAVDDLRLELRAHLSGLHAAFAGNLAYWETAW